MKTKSIHFTIILCIAFFGFSSCSDNDDDGDDMNIACADFGTEWEEVLETLSTFSDNPTSQNCENYKAALMDFYGDFEDCSLWGNQYQEAIDGIQQMDCTEIES